MKSFKLVPVAATFCFAGALSTLAAPGCHGAPDTTPYSVGYLLFALALSLLSFLTRRTTAMLVAGLSLVAAFAFLDLLIWPSHSFRRGLPMPPVTGCIAQWHGLILLALAVPITFLGAWRCRSAKVSARSALLILCWHLVMFKSIDFDGGGDIEDTIVAAVVLLPTTLGPSLLPWPGRSLALLPASALVPAFVALNGVYSQTHWPGGYLLPGLPVHASAEEWRLRLLLLTIALATTALRLAWRRWARKGAAGA